MKAIEYSLSETFRPIPSTQGAEKSSPKPQRSLRRFVLVAALAMMALFGFLGWRALNPELSDEEQIATQMEEMRAAVENRNAAKITRYVGDEFSWNGADARTFRASLAQALVQWRDVKVNLTNQKTSVRGASASTIGSYVITLREADLSTPQTYKGNFAVQWQRTRNGWRMTGARGGEELIGTLDN